MKSVLRGNDTLSAEIANIGSQALWVLVDDKEYCLPYDQFPWFRNATIAQITNIQLLHNNHLYWPDMDIDLSLSILDNPSQFPLIANNDY